MEKACCFTGHRQIEYSEMDRLEIDLPYEIRELAEKGYSAFYAGGAIGFDTLAALAVLKVRDSGEDIELHLILPCKGQDKNWSLRDRHLYRDIIERADSVTVLEESYSPYSMLKRNTELVNNSDLCLCYLAHELGDEKSGTADTVKKAHKKGIEVKNMYR